MNGPELMENSITNPLFLSFRLAKIKEWIDSHDSGAVIIPLSGALESKVGRSVGW